MMSIVMSADVLTENWKISLISDKDNQIFNSNSPLYIITLEGVVGFQLFLKTIIHVQEVC